LPLWPGNRPGSPNGGTAAAGRKNWAARGDSPVSKRRVGEIHLRQHQDQCSFELNRAHCHRAMIRQPKYLIECPMSIPKIGQTAAPPRDLYREARFTGDWLPCCPRSLPGPLERHRLQLARKQGRSPGLGPGPPTTLCEVPHRFM
jgi:hypothetical protein